MDLNKIGLSNFFEWSVFFLVIFSTITINLKNVDVEVEELEVTHISGTVELTTESSMDALGLNNFRVGALATIEMSVNMFCEEYIAKTKVVKMLKYFRCL